MIIDDETLIAMEAYGGSFVKTLSCLYRLADNENRRKLETTFSNYFEKYREISQTKQKQNNENTTQTDSTKIS